MSRTYRKPEGTGDKLEVTFVKMPGMEIHKDRIIWPEHDGDKPRTIKDILDEAEVAMTETCCVLSSVLTGIGGLSDFDGTDKTEDSMRSQAENLVALIKTAATDARAIQAILF